ncbi:MAG: hypothetical protein QW622_03140 [Candidatus Pacearchaeota archaeon]
MNKTRKKGQVTLFIIIAILIVAAGIAGYFVYQNYQKAQEQIKMQTFLPVKQVIDDCFNISSNDALFISGLQGGYTEPKQFLETNLSKIAYWYYEGRNIQPSIEDVENEISSYINIALPLCFSLNAPKTFELDYDKARTTTTIKENEILFAVDFPVIAKQQELSIKFNKFDTKIDSNFSKIYQIASEIVENEVSNPDYVPISNYTLSNFDILIMPYDTKTLIYAIVDNSSLIYEQPYILMFANKFK